MFLYCFNAPRSQHINRYNACCQPITQHSGAIQPNSILSPLHALPFHERREDCAGRMGEGRGEGDALTTVSNTVTTQGVCHPQHLPTRGRATPSNRRSPPNIRYVPTSAVATHHPTMHPAAAGPTTRHADSQMVHLRLARGWRQGRGGANVHRIGYGTPSETNAAAHRDRAMTGGKQAKFCFFW